MENFHFYLQELFGEESPFINLSLFLIAIITGVVIHQIFFRTLGKIAKKTHATEMALLLQKLKAPALFLIIILSIVMMFPIVEITENISDTFHHILSIVIIIGIAWISIKAVGVAKVLILRRYDLEASDNLKARKVYTQLRVLERIVIVVILIIAVSTCLMTFEKIRQVGVSLLASAGLAGVIIGFAAQKSIATIVAGFQIAITQPIRLDDVVIVEGEWGRVEEITLTYVVIKIWDERRLVVPITYFIDTPFQNWTRVSSEILGTVFLYMDYTVPFDAIREELTRLLEGNKFWDGKVNVLQVTNATEKTVEFRALVSAANSGNAWELRVFLREKLIEFLQKNYSEALPKSRITIDEKEKVGSSIKNPEKVPD